MRICAAGSQKHRIGVPSEGSDGAADGFLEVLADPPVVFGFEIADCYYAGAGAYCEFRFGGGPADEGGGAVDAEEDEGGFPACGGGFPDVGIAVCCRVDSLLASFSVYMVLESRRRDKA